MGSGLGLVKFWLSIEFFVILFLALILRNIRILIGCREHRNSDISVTLRRVVCILMEIMKGRNLSSTPWRTLTCYNRSLPQWIDLVHPLLSARGQFKSKEFLLRQSSTIFGRHHFVRQFFKCVFRNCVIFLRTLNQSNEWIFSLLNPTFLCIIEIEMHLSSIGMGEFAEL